MNVVGGFGAYSLYPYLTFHKRWAVLLAGGRLPAFVCAGIDKLLEARGWTAVHGLRVESEMGSLPGELDQGRRFCGDNRCFVVGFALQIMQEARAFPLLCMNSWNLVVLPSSTSRTHFLTEGGDKETCYTAGLNTVEAFRERSFLGFRHAPLILR